MEWKHECLSDMQSQFHEHATNFYTGLEQLREQVDLERSEREESIQKQHNLSFLLQQRLQTLSDRQLQEERKDLLDSQKQRDDRTAEILEEIKTQISVERFERQSEIQQQCVLSTELEDTLRRLIAKVDYGLSEAEASLLQRSVAECKDNGHEESFDKLLSCAGATLHNVREPTTSQSKGQRRLTNGTLGAQTSLRACSGQGANCCTGTLKGTVAKRVPPHECSSGSGPEALRTESVVG